MALQTLVRQKGALQPSHARIWATFTRSYAVSSHENSKRSMSGISFAPVAQSSAKYFDEVPGDSRIPLLSFMKDVFNLGKARKYMFRYMHETFLKHGEIARFTFLGTSFVVVSNPDVVEEICRLEDAQPSRTEHFRAALAAMIEIRNELHIPSGLFQLEGQEWADLRQILSRRLLRPIEVKNYFDGFSSTAESLINEVKLQQDSHGVVEDLRPIIDRWSLESLGTFVFGKRIGLMSKSPDKAAETIFKNLQGMLLLSQMLSGHKAIKYLFPWKYNELIHATTNIHDAGLQLVESVMKRIKNALDEGKEIDGGSAKSLVAYLMAKDQLSPQEVVTHAIDMFSAGLDTTTVTSGWLIHLVSSHPDVQEQLYNEIQECVPGDTPVTHAILQRMPYLRACMKEAARLYPAAHGFLRIYDKDIVAGGYHFPAQTFFFCSNYNMGRNEKIFADPMTFKPEQWLRDRNQEGKGDEEMPHAFASLPFGFGPRSCVGRRISEAEMQTLIVSLLRTFKLRYLGEKQFGEAKPLLGLDKPLKIAFEPRSSLV